MSNPSEGNNEPANGNESEGNNEPVNGNESEDNQMHDSLENNEQNEQNEGDDNEINNSEPQEENEGEGLDDQYDAEQNEVQDDRNDDENPDGGEGEGINESNNPQDGENNAHEEQEAENNDQNNSLASFDENADFPVFANKFNRKLNDIIVNYKKEIKLLVKEIREDSEMVKILTEHRQSVENQVKKREKMLEEMTQSVTMQNHTIEVVKRQIGKVKSQRKTLENEELSLQERFNILQQNIAKANEKMDSYKLNMKNILEELEQWALAARQKEDDKLNIEKYYRHDEWKIKETMLQIEKLTQEVNIRMRDWEREVTETQSAQIELERTTEQLRKLQEERQDFLDQLIRTQDSIKNLSDDLRAECDRYYKNKVELGKNKEELDKNIKLYEDSLKMNKSAEENIKVSENKLSKAREQFQNNQNQYNELHNDIEIKKNELSALAKELSNKTNETNYLKNDLEKKKKNLDEAKSEYSNKKDEIESNSAKYKDAKALEEEKLKINSEKMKELKIMRENLEKTVNEWYDESQRLCDWREKEANMIGDINNVISAKKNLKANIVKLDNEISKQSEWLYNVAFQIQLMERKVDWVQGKRTQEETNEINKKTEILEKTTNDLAIKKSKIEGSLIMIDEDLRAVNTKWKTATEEKDRLNSIIEELELENMKTGQDLQKIVKKKEDVLVEHDLMKWEIKKIYDRLLNEANTVFTKENKLAQLEISIKDREKEINVHKSLLVAEHKSAGEERQKTAMELSLKLTRAKNLKLKYESLIQKNKRGDEGEEKYSQAYYVIQTAQEKEELQRQKDEMQGKITKCQKDLRSLQMTLDSWKGRNDKLKKGLILKQKGEVDKAKIEQLEQKVETENKEMWENKKELDGLSQGIQSLQQKIDEKTMQIEVLNNDINNFQGLLGKQLEVSNKKKESKDRANTRFDKIVKDKKVNLQDTDIGAEVEWSNAKLKNQFLKNSIAILSNELDEVKNIFNNEMQDYQIPSRPMTVKSVSSSKSHNTSRVAEE